MEALTVSPVSTVESDRFQEKRNFAAISSRNNIPGIPGLFSNSNNTIKKFNTSSDNQSFHITAESNTSVLFQNTLFDRVNVNIDGNDSNYFGNHCSKKLKISNENVNNLSSSSGINFQHKQQLESMQKYYDSLVQSIKLDFETKITDKDNQMAKFTKNFALINSKLETDNKLLQEENRILKKAVTIQDNKVKELLMQNQKYNETVGQAVTYIQQIEQQNHQLRSEVNYYRNQFVKENRISFESNFPPPPPPDIY